MSTQDAMIAGLRQRVEILEAQTDALKLYVARLCMAAGCNTPDAAVLRINDLDGLRRRVADSWQLGSEKGAGYHLRRFALEAKQMEVTNDGSTQEVRRGKVRRVGQGSGSGIQ